MANSHMGPMDKFTRHGQWSGEGGGGRWVQEGLSRFVMADCVGSLGQTSHERQKRRKEM